MSCGIEDYKDTVVSDQIQEIRICPFGRTMDLIEKFPALKVTGLVEDWDRRQVFVVFSESGFCGITHAEDVGYFDPEHEGGDGRWEWEYNMMEPINVRFVWLQTGEVTEVNYRFPFPLKWNQNDYVREVNGVILIPVTGQRDFYIENDVLLAYYGFSENVTIPDNVSEIRAEAFKNHSEMKTVMLPNGLKVIGKSAFQGCCNLERIDFPRSVKVLSAEAFRECASLKEIKIPGSVRIIAKGLFAECTNLETVVLGDGVRKIEESAFVKCPNLKHISIPGSIREKIHSRAFEQNEALTIYGKSGSQAEKYATEKGFRMIIEPSEPAKCAEKNEPSKCDENIERLFQLEKCKAASQDKFWNIKTVKGNTAIHGYKGSETEIFVPSTIKGKRISEIGDFLFSVYANDMTPDKISHRKTIKKVIISDGIKKLGEGAFWGCEALESVIVPASVRKFGRGVFKNCPNVTIYAPSQSAVRSYAKQNGIRFVKIKWPSEL